MSVVLNSSKFMFQPLAWPGEGARERIWLDLGAVDAALQQRRAPNASRPERSNSQSAQRNYQHYIELARAESASGNIVGAENYYQHAEHYFRTMNSGQETT